jgi:antitoxin (DNA-binding transcriptional repressor) of toxin-antitoxin stability system
MVMTTNAKARTYSKSKLKAHMLEIMRELELTGEEAIVTDHGRPVLRIVPIQRGRSVSQVFQPYRSKQKLKFLEPPDTSTLEEWAQP